MSAAALLTAVEARLRSVLSDPTGRKAGVQPTGRPPTNCGQVYYAVHWPGSRSEDPNPLSHDVVHDLTVTVTARMGYSPRDRKGAEVVSLTRPGVIALAEAVADKGVIHGYDALLAETNALIPGTAEYDELHGGGVTKDGFSEELVLLDYGPLVEQSAEWVGGEPGGDGERDVLSVDVRFGRARRVQVLG